VTFGPHLAPRNLARFAGGRFEKIVKGPEESLLALGQQSTSLGKPLERRSGRRPASFRQAGQPQALRKLGEVFGSPQGDQIREIGNTQRGFELTQACHRFLRFG
jgi:hypothetical protein